VTIQRLRFDFGLAGDRLVAHNRQVSTDLFAQLPALARAGFFATYDFALAGVVAGGLTTQ
jgi:hypothetical protein